MKQFLQIHSADTVAVALQDLPGIPAGHKFALRDIAEGEDIIKYGNPIGHATRLIRKGELVDHKNIVTNLDKRPTPEPDSPPALPIREGVVTSAIKRMQSSNDSAPSLIGRAGGESFTFDGYPRPDGQVGIRNDIWVIPTVGCVNGICRQIVEKAKAELSIVHCPLSIVHYPHPYGCSQLGEDHENTRLILRDMVLHPNAGGVLVVGLGCENNQPREFEKLLGDYDRQRIRFMVCQEVEGDEIEAGVQIVKELYEQAQTFARVPVPISKLRVGLKCGGSDGFSGITANPLLGAFSDWLCAQGGTTILTEVPEMFGAEHLLMRRAISDKVLQDIIRLINDFKEYYISHGQPVGENPSPGNKAGGISTLEEKALGCTQKGGTSPVMGVLKYGDRLHSSFFTLHSSFSPSGLFLLSAPGNDLVASTALAAAGCQLVLFTTGRGTPFATFVPTLKVSTNSDLARRKPNWVDFNAGTLVGQDDTMDSLLQRFITHVIAVANGHPTQAELSGNDGIAIWKDGVTL